MGRLVGMTCYSCGPIDRCPDGGRTWREDLSKTLNEMGILVLDPLKKPFSIGLESDDHRAVRSAWKRDDVDRFSGLMKTVRHADLRLVDGAGFLVVKLDMDIPMCGTYEEVFWANRLKRPILVWCPQGLEAIPDWLYGTLPSEEFFPSLESLVEYLNRINTREIEPYSASRWLFLEPALLYTPQVLAAINEECTRAWSV